MNKYPIVVEPYLEVNFLTTTSREPKMKAPAESQKMGHGNGFVETSKINFVAIE
jgi:hypothetical protein